MTLLQPAAGRGARQRDSATARRTRNGGQSDCIYVLVAPSTLPLTLYRLLKNVYQSFRTFLCSSLRSCHSGRQSGGGLGVSHAERAASRQHQDTVRGALPSGLSEDCASARDASLPANTGDESARCGRERGAGRSVRPDLCTSHRVRTPCCR